MAFTQSRDSLADSSQSTEPISSYKTHRLLVTRFLENIFPKGDFHVNWKDDQLVLQLPRPLSLEENDILTEWRGMLLLSESDSELDSPISLKQKSLTDWRSPQGKIKAVQAKLKAVKIYNYSVSTTFSLNYIRSDVKEPLEQDLELMHRDSDTTKGRLSVSSLFYGTKISEGETSKIFAVEAHRPEDRRSRAQERYLKVAVKRLSRHTRPEHFRREHNALVEVTKNHHRNIVELLDAFTYQDTKKRYYNFSFPLAIGSLEELFGYRTGERPWEEENVDTVLAASRLSDDVYCLALQCLWSEFEGLASALTHLHKICQICHADIKASNVLLYKVDGQGGSVPILTAKLTDFGLAVDFKTKWTLQRGSKAAQSAWQYDAPEIYNASHKRYELLPVPRPIKDSYALNAKDLMSGDVWRLGCLFLEMLTFLVKGFGSVAQFRSFITTPIGMLASDGSTDFRFDDGEKVKLEVLHWLSRLASKDVRAQEMHDLVRLMLDEESRRPSSGDVAHVLRRLSFSPYSDGARILTFTPSDYVGSPSLIDRYKQTVETNIGNSISWWPFEDGKRSCPVGYSRISWFWSSKQLHVDVPEDAAQAYKSTCTPVSDITDPKSRPAQSGSPGSRLSENSSSRVPSVPIPNTDASANVGPSSSFLSGSQYQTRTDDTFDNGPAHRIFPLLKHFDKEIYWCVDKAWSEPQRTELCSLQHGGIIDDENLYERLTQKYQEIRTWKGKLLSWKSCLGIEFIKFAKTPTNSDHVVKIHIGLPPSSVSCYDISRILPEEVHLKVAAAELIAGMHYPEGGKDRTTSLSMIPKRIRNSISLTAGFEEWGMRGLQGFSLSKILTWIALLTVAGLAFVIFWLVFINKTDLQNAFVPFTFLATMLLIGLGVPQLLAVG